MEERGFQCPGLCCSEMDCFSVPGLKFALVAAVLVHLVPGWHLVSDLLNCRRLKPT